MADYSYSEIMRMQNDAVRRVEEMQKRARQTAGLPAEGEKIKASNLQAQEPHRIPMPDTYLESLKDFAAGSSHTGEMKPESLKTQAPSEDARTEDGDFSFNAEIDSDKALILSLVLLLSQEHADGLLILSLLYMLT